MKKSILILFVLCFAFYAQAQISIPVQTTTQRDALVSVSTGTAVFNSTLKTHDIFNGSVWNSFGDVIKVPSTVTAAATTGNRTIDKISGTVNIAAGDSTVTVTNSKVSTSSLIIPVIRTNDVAARIKNVVPGSGSFVIRTTPVTAETSIGFIVIN